MRSQLHITQNRANWQQQWDYSKALEYYHQALELNSRLPQALESIAVIYRYLGTKASEKREFSLAKKSFEIAISYLIEGQEAIKLVPNNYIEAQNWLKVREKLERGRRGKRASERI